ncbi:MAG: VWA domain-containing protein [Deferribacteraceae bacterium]|nr:VWA domain-containing protein [Deferribacteraceae bacterium]
MHRIFALSLTICVLLFQISNADASNYDYNKNLDVIIVFDTSASMAVNDANGVAQEGVKLFIDAMQHKDSRLGIVPFNSKLGYSKPLTDISPDLKRNITHNVFGELKYSGQTDFGLALKEADGLFKKAPRRDNKKVVLFFTDGSIDIRNSDNSFNDAEMARSEKEMDEVLKSADYPVYTIGFISNGLMARDQQKMRDTLDKIAHSSGAKSFFPKDINEFQRDYTEILADLLQTKIINVSKNLTGSKRESFNIPEAVAEANIIITGSGITGIELTPPDDSKPEEYRSDSKTYSLIKLINPTKGEWNIKLTATQGAASVNLLFNYDIDIKLDIRGAPSRNKTVTLSAVITSLLGDESVSEAFLKTFYEHKIEVHDSDGNLIATMPLKLENGVFNTDYKIPDVAGKIFFTAVLKSEYLNRIKKIELEVSNQPPALTGSPNIKLYNLSGNFDIDMNEIIKDPDGDIIRYKVINSDKSVTPVIKNGILNVKTGIFAFGAKQITISASDGFSEIEGGVTLRLTLIPALLIIIVISGALIIIIIFRASKPALFGTLIVKRGDDSVAIYLKGKGPVTLLSLLKKEGKVFDKRLDKLYITMHKGGGDDFGDAIEINNRSGLNIRDHFEQFIVKHNGCFIIDKDNSDNIHITYKAL